MCSISFSVQSRYPVAGLRSGSVINPCLSQFSSVCLVTPISSATSADLKYSVLRSLDLGITHIVRRIVGAVKRKVYKLYNPLCPSGELRTAGLGALVLVLSSGFCPYGRRRRQKQPSLEDDYTMSIKGGAKRDTPPVSLLAPVSRIPFSLPSGIPFDHPSGIPFSPRGVSLLGPHPGLRKRPFRIRNGRGDSGHFFVGER